MSDSMMKLYLKHWDTPKPQSNGVALLDVYVDNDWVEMPKPHRTIVTCRSVTHCI